MSSSVAKKRRLEHVMYSKKLDRDKERLENLEKEYKAGRSVSKKDSGISELTGGAETYNDGAKDMKTVDTMGVKSAKTEDATSAKIEETKSTNAEDGMSAKTEDAKSAKIEDPGSMNNDILDKDVPSVVQEQEVKDVTSYTDDIVEAVNPDLLQQRQDAENVKRRKSKKEL